ncbi:hypothetical protein V6B08_08825 [Ferrovibrio sp. MS7]|uniref:hypothetical protein n=1 Tax=Ferrovibrio plantarum TaxID=3119164 RepID=UPI003135FB01
MVAAFIDSSENMTLGVSPWQKATTPASGAAGSKAGATKAQNALDDSQAVADGKQHRGLFGPEGFTFSSFLDIINPLQHIPVVNTIYRAVTGDTIENGPRLIGGALFGGPLGLAASVVNGIIDEETGKDIGSHALAAIGIDDGTGRDSTIGLAQNGPPPETMAETQAWVGTANGPLAVNAPTANALVSQNPAPQNVAQLRARASGEREAATRDTGPRTVAEAATIPYSPVVMNNLAAPLPADQAQPQQQNLPSAPASRGDDGRKWYSVDTQQGGVVTRGVGAQPITSNNITQKFGVTKGTAYAGSVPAPQPQQQAQPVNASANPGMQTVPADFLERANAAYAKYNALKQAEPRQGRVDQTY